MTAANGPTVTSQHVAVAVGKGIPADIPHAVSVSLPTWQDNIDYEEGRLTDVMETGYPRFFIHRSIQKLAAHLESKFAKPDESSLLVPTAKIADSCRDFMQSHHAKMFSGTTPPSLPVRIVRFCLLPPTDSPPLASGAFEDQVAEERENAQADPCSALNTVKIYIILFPKEFFPLAKAYWQHTGDGISSRMAERCLYLIQESRKPGQANANTGAGNAQPISPTYPRPHFRNRHYARGKSTIPSDNIDPPSLANSTASLRDLDLSLPDESMSPDQSVYVEERYGRNLTLTSATRAKRALRRRIAGTLLADRASFIGHTDGGCSADYEETADPEAGETTRSGTGVTGDDVYLFPTGMSAIFHAHQIAMLEKRTESGEEAVGKSVCFGFPYTDTLKILQKWGPGCHHFGNGTDEEIDELEKVLNAQVSSGSPPILALFCEFPSNPLLRCPDLPRLRSLADKHSFLIVVDETIGNFVNVEVLPFADMVVSSLTKVFSGDTNVMGGSLVLNPRGPHAASLRMALQQDFQDSYWDEDALFMERNSRDFIARIVRININAELLCEMLLHESQRPEAERVIKKVQYPKYETREHYDRCRRKTPLIPGSASSGGNGGGYGGLFSIFFTSDAAASVFYDALSCAKGPSLGTNFTLASPYAILAHYTELDWAAQFGVEKSLVRVSVGLENEQELLQMFSVAADAARKTLQ
ncbi:PLP-dependent transferase [Tilletiaria anomala UBC 951]|uniref:cystathionine gamma-synthase n=1 Tax=Tilletiaria anomala (strain ATCC 24038 / CBS 436.72 / UBC 951) TaxID=1037660 RepID=A0A066WE87_TILAU|nr:PLP-dependent transferase [Tilletiaria anomala UBC 951]KDN52091.1 PLP-dependent transferase [Tilletiaria anomala UBC 951]